MKKILKLTLLSLIMCMFMVNTVYANNCDVTIETKQSVTKDEQFTVDFYVTDIDSARGFRTLTATLDYSKESLTLVKLEGKNGWENPSVDNDSYNPSNGKIALIREGKATTKEIIFRATFKATGAINQSAYVALNDIVIADGDANVKPIAKKKNITITAATTSNSDQNSNGSNGGSTNGNVGSTNGTTSNIGNNNSSKPTTSTTTSNKTTAKDKLPQTGNAEVIYIVAIGAFAIVVGAYAYIKIRKMM